MTGWMMYDNGGFAVAHADTLLSARVGKDVSEHLPIPQLYEDIPKNYNPSEFVTVGMCQKAVVISPRLAYIWAGSLSAASELDSRLRHFESNSVFDIHDLDVIRNEFQDRDLSATIWSAHEYPKLLGFMINTEAVDVPGFGQVVYGGLGEGEFFSLTYELLSNIHPDMALERYDDGLISKAKSDAFVRMRLMDSLLQYRLITNEFRHVATGGAIETLACYADGGFQKLGDYLYAIFAEDDFKTIGFAPRIIIKKTYVSGYLGISVINYASGEEMSVTVPNPGNTSRPFHITKQTHDPWTGPLRGVACIFLQEDGTISHFQEDGQVFRDHVFVDRHKNRPVATEWYQKDMEQKRRRTDSLKVSNNA